MRNLSLNKRPIYLSKINTSGDIPYYEAPIKLTVNYTFSKGGNTDVASYGINDEMFVVINTDVKTGTRFSRLDKVYVLNQVPTTYDMLAEGADFQVKDIMPSINQYQIFLEKLQNGD